MKEKADWFALFVFCFMLGALYKIGYDNGEDHVYDQLAYALNHTALVQKLAKDVGASDKRDLSNDANDPYGTKQFGNQEGPLDNLALPAVFSSNRPPSYTARAVFRYLLHTLHEEYSDEDKQRHPVILLVDDNTTLVDRLRASGLPAWAMTPFSSVSKWQFTGELFMNPVKSHSIDIAYLAGSIVGWQDILEMMQMVNLHGFLLLNLEKVPMFDMWITEFGFGKLSFKMHDYTIYRRESYRAPPSHNAFGMFLIPLHFEVTWKMRYIGKCAYEIMRFSFLLAQGIWQKWDSFRWVDAVTERLDHEHLSTQEHSRRTMSMMHGFGKYLQWSDEEIHDGILAAGLHDFGKLTIPSGILEKPGALTEEEMGIMRRHVAWSERFLKWMPHPFERIVSVVGNHHEMFDGKGYPRGLRGREIAPITHALAIVDAYDAMVSARFYKQAKTQEWAFWELRRCAGKQFDPELVEKFIAYMGNGGRHEEEPHPYSSGPAALSYSA